MKFSRIFTQGLGTPLDGIEFETRTSQLKNIDGSKGSTAITLKVPSFWSQMASDILAQKYLRKADVPAATVRTRLHRARLKLKDVLGGNEDEE